VFGLSVDSSYDRRCLTTQATRADAPLGNPDVHSGRARSRRAQRSPKKVGPGSAEIYAGDLLRTLEAHRSKNRASLIRKVRVDGERGLFRPEVNHARPRLVRGGDGPGSQGGARPGPKDFPVNRLQNEWRERAERLRLAGGAQVLWGNTESDGMLGKVDKIELIRDYRGVNFPPLPQHEMHWTPNKDAAPWLKNLHWSGGDALSRLVVVWFFP
jgi:hypothetical protein